MLERRFSQIAFADDPGLQNAADSCRRKIIENAAGLAASISSCIADARLADVASRARFAY